MEDRKIAVEALVDAFGEGAMTDHYESGEVVSYDATALLIESPEPLAGRRLVIFHDEPLPAGSPLRQAGRKLRFKMRESLLMGEDALFTGALGELETVPREKGEAS